MRIQDIYFVTCWKITGSSIDDTNRVWRIPLKVVLYKILEVCSFRFGCKPGWENKRKIVLQIERGEYTFRLCYKPSSENTAGDCAIDRAGRIQLEIVL